ncbi:efflux RND transporter periplasmic adaptor subunit [Serratia ficaria]|uniref:efflux RND transporter periplasmic adaptor subunit n=2 Tax=Serratia ficaria TaxID=61651 RepID=UPI00077C349A|nr:efflux RND transporter periplasmic adaptor subunit [Serratia ficaria]CAI1081715.1 Macrolide-specific efflux protein macA precursor [Serratia ficaria]CAI1152673.1 Macrolide-specific efflux protein macA precursor [Serratia ficaria]CAI1187276.1 Macrolide-specific efflux protein macA precursor [Serratia ficaria]CAI1925313.1 Macrolide-specific efflux protein macA precursor [Serratia ficaria]CAI1935810.1 Macrolide-specific efflux protein macA precursor [Serratia ficaria]
MRRWRDMPGKKTARLLLPALAILAAIAGGAALLNRPAAVAAPAVARIDRGDIERNVLATGILKPAQQVNVGAQVNGQLKKLYVKQGDRVVQGQLLAEIDPTLQHNELRKSQAELKSAQAQKLASEAQLTQYRLELKRQLALQRDRAGVPSDLEKARAQRDAQRALLKMNEAQIVQAEMALETARANLAFTRIVAPIDGEVLGIVTQEGQTIVSSQSAPTIMVLANLDTMMVHTRISETDILRVRTGQPLWFYAAADPRRRYDSAMGAIQQAPAEALEADPLGRSLNQQASAVYYNGVFAIANGERRLRTAMTAQVFITTDRATGAVRVPMAALGASPAADRYEVQVRQGERIVPRRVRIGISDRRYAEVLQGLSEGEWVLLAPQPDDKEQEDDR